MTSSTSEQVFRIVPLDARRVARLIRSLDGALRVALVDLASGREFASFPIPKRTREELERVVGVIDEARSMLARRGAPAAPASPVEVSAPTPAAASSDPPFVPTFADKVETLAARIKSIRVADAARRRAANGGRPVALPYYPDDTYTVEPGREYWYVRDRSSRRYAVDVRTEQVMPMNSKGIIGLSTQGDRKVSPYAVQLDDMGEYDWASRFFKLPKLDDPPPLAWVRSTLAPPAPQKPRKPTTELRRQANVRLSTAPNYAPLPPNPKFWDVADDERVIRGFPGAMRGGWQGTKYESTRSMSNAQVAKLIRADIQDAIDKGLLPPMDVSVVVKASRTSSSILVRINRIDAGVQVLNPEWVKAIEGGMSRSDARELGEYTRDGQGILESVRAIYNRFNLDNSDSQTDYYNVRYYGDVAYGEALRMQDRFNVLAMAGLAPRRDAYLEHDLNRIVREEMKGKVPLSLWVRAMPDIDEMWRIAAVDERPRGAVILSEMQSPFSDVLEIARAVVTEALSRKQNSPAPQRSRR